jgi:hypothetical protein
MLLFTSFATVQTLTFHVRPQFMPHDERVADERLSARPLVVPVAYATD